MYSNIIVPIDGSDISMRAVDSALAIAQAFNSQVHLVCVIDSYPFTGIRAGFAYGQEEYLSVAKGNAEKVLSQAEEYFVAKAVSVQKHVVVHQLVYEGILDIAKQVNADLLVISSHGRKGLEKLLLGSETTRVLQHAEIPVLVVRPTSS